MSTILHRIAKYVFVIKWLWNFQIRPTHMMLNPAAWKLNKVFYKSNSELDYSLSCDFDYKQTLTPTKPTFNNVIAKHCYLFE